MRSQNDIVRTLRDALVAIEELKTAQPVGSDQLVATRYDSGLAYDTQVTITAPFQSVGSSFKLMRITVERDIEVPGSILLSEMIPKLMYTNGTRISNWTAPSSTSYGISPINSDDLTKNTYLLFIVAPTNTVMRLKVYTVANAKVNFTIEDLI